MAFIVGKLTGRKVGISLLAGPVELYAGGSPISNYSYCNPLPELNKRAKLFKWVLNTSNVITVTGNYTKDFLVSIGINENKIFVLPHVIDNKFNNKEIKKEYDIIYIGRLAKVKHVDILLKAVQVLKDKYPNIKVAIVGNGECKKYLEDLTTKIDLNKNVHFAGYQTNVWDWYNKAKISVLTSEREGFPYSVVESLKCGVPVVASDCGDINDLVKNQYNGFIVKSYTNYELFACNINKILENKKLLNKFSVNSLRSLENTCMENISFVWENNIMPLVK
jgi:glycosyltransferase involved in cell wall biosynthesis